MNLSDKTIFVSGGLRISGRSVVAAADVGATAVAVDCVRCCSPSGAEYAPALDVGNVAAIQAAFEAPAGELKPKSITTKAVTPSAFDRACRRDCQCTEPCYRMCLANLSTAEIGV